ncbi:Exoenzyme S synthesis regulatory protein ExsA [Thalassovita gelatinovora]|uniref:Exoenzyme S synthesis regulatory protein ExsA n=1 Tax=Thalassovita gelatinovora TaxID=53501 RepID=A0A0P1F671_THAGE|nr:AraC family transcriptional regulator [Thalassovita gelatinovora]QIZ80907.1 helix-turn-helix domain-containing protein [Thalassovita gelatinovora]CUH63393.1 Exoenzyme S synthesis regulatory protein ExsA [Thalassovita gelatinovora]SEQ66294.1 AraC-type DNA-binding protein [Thalassovita gelatinovora]
MIEGYALIHDEREALHQRTLRVRFPEGFATLLFLQHGVLRHGSDGSIVTGPALCFWPGSERPTLTLDAGSATRLLGLSDTIILDAIGARSESVHLRMLVERPFTAALEEQPKIPQVEMMFSWFGYELNSAHLQSPMTLSAYLRLLLITALRVHNPEPIEKGGEQTNILRRFRHLVELHYRDHWQVSAYASELGVEYERLHRICKRETGRAPAELVHERLIAEAKARLENSGHPLKKIGADLGFADGSRFSHFFKRRTGMSPGAYRAIVSRPAGEDLSELRRNFSDWP